MASKRRARESALQVLFGLAPGEFGVLFAAALGHCPVGHRVGQGQRLGEPALVKGERIGSGLELQRAVETLGVARLIIRRGMLKEIGRAHV